MFIWRKICFLPDYREFFCQFSGDCFLRQLSCWEALTERCSVNRAHCSVLCYTEQSYVHSQELESTKHCQTRAPPSLNEGSQSHPTGGLQAREGSERLSEVPLAGLNPYGPLCPHVLARHRSPPTHCFSSTQQIILRCTTLLHVWYSTRLCFWTVSPCTDAPSFVFSIHLWTIWAVPRHKQSNCLLLCLRIQRPLCILVKDVQETELVWVCVCVCVCVCVTEILLAWNLVKHNQLHISERIYHVYLPTGQLLDIPFKIN